jgi:transcription elongation factor
MQPWAAASPWVSTARSMTFSRIASSGRWSNFTAVSTTPAWHGSPSASNCDQPTANWPVGVEVPSFRQVGG